MRAVMVFWGYCFDIPTLLGRHGMPGMPGGLGGGGPRPKTSRTLRCLGWTLLKLKLSSKTWIPHRYFMAPARQTFTASGSTLALSIQPLLNGQTQGATTARRGLRAKMPRKAPYWKCPPTHMDAEAPGVHIDRFYRLETEET